MGTDARLGIQLVSLFAASPVRRVNSVPVNFTQMFEIASIFEVAGSGISEREGPPLTLRFRPMALGIFRARSLPGATVRQFITTSNLMFAKSLGLARKAIDFLTKRLSAGKTRSAGCPGHLTECLGITVATRTLSRWHGRFSNHSEHSPRKPMMTARNHYTRY